MADRTKARPINEPLELTDATMRAKLEQMERELAAQRDRTNNAGVNKGLRMILFAAIAIVAISWVGTIAVEYMRIWQMQQLGQIDQDAMRIMCAIDPPSEKEFNRTHLCEVVAREGRRPPDGETATN